MNPLYLFSFLIFLVYHASAEENQEEKTSTLGAMSISYPAQWSETVLSPNSLQIFSEEKMIILGDEIKFGILFEKKVNPGVTIDTLLQMLKNNFKVSNVNLIEKANHELEGQNTDLKIGNLDGYQYKKVMRNGNKTYDLVVVSTLKDGNNESKNVTHSSFHVDKNYYYSVSLTYPLSKKEKFSSIASKVLRSIKIVQTFELFINHEASQIYKKRTNKSLTKQELQIVGLFKGISEGVQWEVERKKDGTFRTVIVEHFDKTEDRYYVQGVWGIENNKYYYTDLVATLDYVEGQVEQVDSTIQNINDTSLITVEVNEDEEEYRSIETRTDKLSYKEWSILEIPELNVLISEEYISQAQNKQYLKSLVSININRLKDLYMKIRPFDQMPKSIKYSGELEKLRFKGVAGDKDWLYSPEGFGTKSIGGKIILIAPEKIGTEVVVCYANGSVKVFANQEISTLVDNSITIEHKKK